MKRGVYADVHPWFSVLFLQGFYFWQSKGTLWMWYVWQSGLKAELSPPHERTTEGEPDGEFQESQKSLTGGCIRVGPANNTRSFFGGFFWKNSSIHLKYSFWGIVIWVTCQRQILSHIIKVENDVERSGFLKKKCFTLSFSAELLPDHKRAKVITSGANKCAKKICKSMHYHSAECWYGYPWLFLSRLGSEVFWYGLLTVAFQRLHSANFSNYWSDCATL